MPTTPLTVNNRVFYKLIIGNRRTRTTIDETINKLIVDVLEPANRMIVDWHIQINPDYTHKTLIVIRTAPIPTEPQPP